MENFQLWVTAVLVHYRACFAYVVDLIPAWMENSLVYAFAASGSCKCDLMRSCQHGRFHCMHGVGTYRGDNFLFQDNVRH